MKFYTLHDQQMEEIKFQKELRSLNPDALVWRSPSGDLAIGMPIADYDSEENMEDYFEAGVVKDYLR